MKPCISWSFRGLACASAFAGITWAASAVADDSATTGSPDVIINGRPAQRLGDQNGAENGAPGDASSNVFINGKPAAIGGKCPDGTPPTPSPNVFVDGKPALLCGG